MTTWPLSDEDRQGIASVADEVAELDAAVGGWTMRTDCSATGLVTTVTYGKSVDIPTSMRVMNLVHGAPSLLVGACQKLLEADEAARAETQ